uniref:sushi, von Willebrand factor type A, EGF and pentraxin domain-containing protein 1-like n=1 Tax=Styela clava TaxID=7725 RepID=UPI001939366B|nr:sushi, von Willebrand factor type A, EGF and pentraxin domain-containing protein 1-like [Styela clava]
MESKLYQINKTMEESATNLVPPSVVGVKETTTPQGYKDKKTSLARTSVVPATSPWSPKEASLSTVRQETSKVEHSTVRSCPAHKAPDNGTVDIAPDLGFGQTIKYSCNAGYVLQGSNIGKCQENGTWGEVPTCVVDLACDFESINPTCGYTKVDGTFQREYRDNDATDYVLAGNGTIRSLPKALAGNESLCMSVDIKGTSDGELMAKAHNGNVTKAIWPFSASTNWTTEKFTLTKVNSTDTKVQLELEASGNVELDNITTLNFSECYGLATPCAKRNLDNVKISPEQDLYSVNQEVSYSCSNGSTLKTGQTATCKPDGSWSTTPVCTSAECGVAYNSKCFQAIVYDVKNVSNKVANSICRKNLANIYDFTHYNLILEYLRSMIPDGESEINVRTGMNYKNGQLNSATGQAILLPTEVWRPNIDTSRSTVIFAVRQNPEDDRQGFFNIYPQWTAHGAICENDI